MSILRETLLFVNNAVIEKNSYVCVSVCLFHQTVKLKMFLPLEVHHQRQRWWLPAQLVAVCRYLSLPLRSLLSSFATKGRFNALFKLTWIPQSETILRIRVVVLARVMIVAVAVVVIVVVVVVIVVVVVEVAKATAGSQVSKWCHPDTTKGKSC